MKNIRLTLIIIEWRRHPRLLQQLQQESLTQSLKPKTLQC